jgi:hypothetical protein
MYDQSLVDKSFHEKRILSYSSFELNFFTNLLLRNIGLKSWEIVKYLLSLNLWTHFIRWYHYHYEHQWFEVIECHLISANKLFENKSSIVFVSERLWSISWFGKMQYLWLANWINFFNKLSSVKFDSWYLLRKWVSWSNISFLWMN